MVVHRDALYEGRLGEALSLAHRAIEMLDCVGLSGKHAVRQANDLATRVALLATIEGASPSEPDCCEFLVNERIFQAKKECVARSPKLAALFTLEEEDCEQRNENCLSPEWAGQKMGERRLRARVEGTTTLGFKCFLCYREFLSLLKQHVCHQQFKSETRVLHSHKVMIRLRECSRIL